MSIQSEINRLTAAKSDIATAIANKGVAVPSGTKIDGMVALIDGIESGGNELIVTAPTGSTVTVTKGGVTKTATGDNGVYTFKGLEVGEWTVTAALGGQISSKVVAVVAETVEMSYLSDNFADNDWSNIIAACQSSRIPNTWEVGDSKQMTLNGVSYNIDIIGKNHDTYTAGGTAPLTFGLHDCYDTFYEMNSTRTSVGGYDSALMHTTHLPAIKSTMPAEVQAAIKPVNKKASSGNRLSAIETISCELFLLAEIEVFGAIKHSWSGEGSQYAYYSAGNSKVKRRSGSAVDWWLRSPDTAQYGYFDCVGTNGGQAYAYAEYKCGVSFAFCF